jgi:hypothetical protein
MADQRFINSLCKQLEEVDEQIKAWVSKDVLLQRRAAILVLLKQYGVSNRKKSRGKSKRKSSNGTRIRGVPVEDVMAAVLRLLVQKKGVVQVSDIYKAVNKKPYNARCSKTTLGRALRDLIDARYVKKTGKGLYQATNEKGK